jgi:hypothetical protein
MFEPTTNLPSSQTYLIKSLMHLQPSSTSVSI